jgi:hypothetical protein
MGPSGENLQRRERNSKPRREIALLVLREGRNIPCTCCIGIANGNAVETSDLRLQPLLRDRREFRGGYVERHQGHSDPEATPDPLALPEDVVSIPTRRQLHDVDLILRQVEGTHQEMYERGVLAPVVRRPSGRTFKFGENLPQLVEERQGPASVERCAPVL